MSWRRVRAGALAALIIGLAPTAARQASAAPVVWTGTITEDLTSSLHQTGFDAIDRTMTCHTVITVNANNTMTAQSTYTYTGHEDKKQSANFETVIDDHAEGNASVTYSGAANVDISSDSTYSVNYAGEPSFDVHGTVTNTTTNEKPITNNYGTSKRCSVVTGANNMKLTSQTSLSDSISMDGSYGPYGDPAHYTLTWKLSTGSGGTTPNKQTTPSPKPSPANDQDPKMHLHVTNHGIDVGFQYKGIDLSYQGDWGAKQDKPGSPPTITSPSKNASLTVDEQPAKTSPAGAARSLIGGSGGNGGGGGHSGGNGGDSGGAGSGGSGSGAAPKVSSRPFAIDGLTGVIDTYTIPGSKNTRMVIVVGDGTHQVVVQMTVTPQTPPQELVEAGAIIGSITLQG